MIYICINTLFHNIDRNNKTDFGIHAREGSDINDFLPYIYNKQSNEFDVYLFVINRVHSKTEEGLYYFKFDSQKTIFHLLDYLDKHFKHTREFLDYWRAQRQDQEYYLQIIAESLSSDLITRYLNLIIKWCQRNGTFYESDSFSIPQNDYTIYDENVIDIPINFIKKTEYRKKPSPSNIQINWDTGFPAFEGDGSESAISLLSFGLSSLGVILSYYGIYKQREVRKDKKRMMRFRKEIFSMFNIKGTLIDPDNDRIETDSELRRIYRFIEINKNKPTACYLVKMEYPCYTKKRNVKNRFTITKEKIREK